MNDPRTWFAKAAPGNLGEMVDQHYAKLAEQRWQAMSKASVPGVSAVAGPNDVAGRLNISWFTDIGYVGTSVFAMVSHDQIGGQYAVWDLDTLLAARLRTLGDGTAPDELFDKLEFKNFTCDVFGGRRSIGMLTRANAHRSIDLMSQAGNFLMKAALAGIEEQFTAAFWGTGKWATDLAVVSGQKFDNASSNPDQTIQQAVEKLVNIWPNVQDYVFVTSLPVWNALMRHERFRGQGAAELPQGSLNRFREITGIPRVVIGRAGQTKTSGFLGKDALIAVAPLEKGMNDPSAGARITWSGVGGGSAEGIATRVMADPINFRTVVDTWLSNSFVLQSPDLGYYLSGAIA